MQQTLLLTDYYNYYFLLLQKELERARLEQENATTAKQNLEKRLQDESMGLHTSYSDLEVSQLKAEIEVSFIKNTEFKILVDFLL